MVREKPRNSATRRRAQETGLRAMGFGEIEDLDPEAMNARHFRGRTDQLRVGSLAHVMNARV
jgi:hypothetical protein